MLESNMTYLDYWSHQQTSRSAETYLPYHDISNLLRPQLGDAGRIIIAVFDGCRS